MCSLGRSVRPLCGPSPAAAPPFGRLAAVRCAFRRVPHHHDRVGLGSRWGQVSEDAGRPQGATTKRRGCEMGPGRTVDGRPFLRRRSLRFTWTIPPKTVRSSNLGLPRTFGSQGGSGIKPMGRSPNKRPQPPHPLLHTARTDRPPRPPTTRMHQPRRCPAKGLVGPDLRLQTHYRSQKMTLAAEAMAERKRSPQRV